MLSTRTSATVPGIFEMSGVGEGVGIGVGVGVGVAVGSAVGVGVGLAVAIALGLAVAEGSTVTAALAAGLAGSDRIFSSCSGVTMPVCSRPLSACQAITAASVREPKMPSALSSR